MDCATVGWIRLGLVGCLLKLKLIKIYPKIKPRLDLVKVEVELRVCEHLLRFKIQECITAYSHLSYVNQLGDKIQPESLKCEVLELKFNLAFVTFHPFITCLNVKLK